MSKFNLSAQCIAITTDMSNNKVFVLSIDPNDISIPSFEINNQNIADLSDHTIKFMQRFLMTHELELSPQLIDIDIKVFNTHKKNSANLIYGFLIKEGVKHFDSHWLVFNPLDSSSQYAPTILEVIQKLK